MMVKTMMKTMMKDNDKKTMEMDDYGWEGSIVPPADGISKLEVACTDGPCYRSADERGRAKNWSSTHRATFASNPVTVKGMQCTRISAGRRAKTG